MNNSQYQSTAPHSSSAKNTQSWGQGGSGFDNYDTTSRPHSYHPRDMRGSISTKISPPPLMRQRTESKVPETVAESSRSKPLSNDHPQMRRQAQHRYVGFGYPEQPQTDRRSLFSRKSSTREIEQVRREHSSESLRQSFTFLKPFLQQENRQRKHSIVSIDSDSTRSSSSTRTSSLSKRTCRLCEKALATSYNPIITCLGCDRPYHDSCRRPPLIDGVDPNRWRCSKCLAGSQRRMSSGFDPLKQNPMLRSAPHSSSRDLAAPNAHTAPQMPLHMPSLKERKERTPQVTASIGDKSGNSNVVPGADLKDEQKPASGQSHDPGRKLDHAKKIHHPARLASSSQRTGGKVQGPLTSPNTPTQISCAPDLSDIIAQHQPPPCTDASSPSDDVPLSNRIQSEKVAVLTMLCSECGRQHNLVKHGDSNVKCLKCRKKDVVSAAGRAEIPETPEGASPCEGHSQTSLQTTHSRLIATTPLSVQPASSPWFRLRLATSKSISDHDASSISVGSPVTPVDLDTPETEFDDCAEDKNQETGRPLTIHNYGNHVDNNGSATATLVFKQLHSSVSTPNDVLDITESTATASKDIGSAGSVPPDSNQRYTNRELARIAIVAADRPELIATEIVDWLARSFHYLEKGHGGWEKSIKAALTRYPEFRGRKIHGERRLYSFVDEETRAQYEQLYHEYCASSGSFAAHSRSLGVGVRSNKAEQIVHETKTEQRPYPVRAIKSAPTNKLKVSWNSKPDHTATTSTNRAPVKTVEEDGSLFMPFERRTTRQTQNLLEIANEGTRESNFHNITLRGHGSSVDRMSQAEKAKRIADIKARPSRKAFFGPDHLLAHTRRYKRLDIHDESDGAWQPKRANQRDHATKLDGEKSLKELFNLPENAIPMNDGPNELAFRDGTLINGKLPRPRQIYRVSRLVGAEPSVRTS